MPGLRAFAAAALLASLPIAAQADHLPVPYGGLAFDDAKHRLWYARFWTGHCTGLSIFVCRSGTPYWHETMRRYAAAAPAGQRAALAARLFALGRRIGHEWAKENDVRKIGTDHIRAWHALLEKGSDGEAAIVRVETEAAALLAKR